MNAIKQLYINSGLITEDGYVKVNDKLWVKSGPYKEQSWNKADKSTLPTKEELNEIHLKLQELIQIQEACGLDSLRKILEEDYPWVWSSTEYFTNGAWFQRMIDGIQNVNYRGNVYWAVPIRRTHECHRNTL